MDKKQYMSPTMKVVEVKAQQMLCGSTKSMNEEELDNSSFQEL